MYLLIFQWIFPNLKQKFPYFDEYELKIFKRNSKEVLKISKKILYSLLYKYGIKCDEICCTIEYIENEIDINKDEIIYIVNHILNFFLLIDDDNIISLLKELLQSILYTYQN